MDKVLAVYNLNQKGIPDTVVKVITELAIVCLMCKKCGKNLQTKKNENTSWVNYKQKTICKNCFPSLQESFKKKFKK